jgi:nitroimidazol reductase NimA-like FMN-containing flavoprotein (pyridoxamine 5'-phosphate oxidase superfamily)
VSEVPPFADNGLEILTESECLRLLGTERIGRVAICQGAVPAVLPVTYAVVGGEVMFFTGSGVKLNAALKSQSVAFEVDHIDIDTKSGWSVLVVGSASPASDAAIARAESVGLYPWAAGPRHHLVRIRSELISGRRLLT